MYFKLLQRRIGEKYPSAEALALVSDVVFRKSSFRSALGRWKRPFLFYIKSAAFVTGFIAFGNIFPKNVHTP